MAAWPLLALDWLGAAVVTDTGSCLVPSGFPSLGVYRSVGLCESAALALFTEEMDPQREISWGRRNKCFVLRLCLPSSHVILN